MAASVQDVKDFYNGFTSNRMVGYRLWGNERIDAAIGLVRRHVRSGQTVVDIGCGIGIATEAAAKLAAPGAVVGADIAEENIRYASLTVREPNVTFRCLDVIEERETLSDLMGGRKVDVFIMIDVIEHLPDDTRHAVFRTMAEMGSEDVTVLLTYPSPHYQRHLSRNEPGELQVIDNVIEVSDIAGEAARHGLEVASYALIDVWRPAQYVHCVLRRRSALETASGRHKGPGSIKDRVKARLRRALNRILLPMRKRRYAAVHGARALGN